MIGISFFKSEKVCSKTQPDGIGNTCSFDHLNYLAVYVSFGIIDKERFISQQNLESS